ncbi:hypothetical protein VTN00DRAFT_9312 [Thermoascus crustaceus]|uniref:uncharacterized protein n=1 Tax=Thermoascus crustaceus TaxID=5088 RepID=UPI0037421158
MPGNGPDNVAPDNAAALPAVESIPSRLSSLNTSPASTNDRDSSVPPSSRSTTAGGTGPAPVAGRKRRSTNAPSRGVAHLTPEQLAKKRANDREAQRAIRERTKAQIEALERKVQELSSQQPYLDLQAALKEKQAIQAENEEIRRKLSAVLEIIQPLVGRRGLSDLASTASRPDAATHLSASTEQNRYTPSSLETTTGGPSYAESTASLESPSPTNPAATVFGVRRKWLNSVDQPWAVDSAFDYQRYNLAHGLDFSGSGERLGLNFLLDGTQQIPKVGGILRRSECSGPSSQVNISPQYLQSFNNPLADQPLSAFSAPIRNVAPTCPLDGILLDFLRDRQQEAAEGVSKQRLVGPPYPSITSLLNPEKSVYSHPISKVFTDILRAFPDISSLPEQVAILYLMFLLMRWQIYPTQQNYDRLPEWLTPRPSQLFTPHPAWIDYLPWPRMRDRLVMSYQDYPFENWFIPYTRTLSLNWPYEATDCLLSSGDSDELLINPVFESHLRNLNNWSLGPAFAKAFPDLVDTTRIKPDTKGNSPIS